jgi:predicted amidohydrolase
MTHIPEEPMINQKHYRSGDSADSLSEVSGAAVGFALSQDLFFREERRLLALHGAEVFIVSNGVARRNRPDAPLRTSGRGDEPCFRCHGEQGRRDGDLTFIGKSNVRDLRESDRDGEWDR